MIYSKDIQDQGDGCYLVTFEDLPEATRCTAHFGVDNEGNHIAWLVTAKDNAISQIMRQPFF